MCLIFLSVIIIITQYLVLFLSGRGPPQSVDLVVKEECSWNVPSRWGKAGSSDDDIIFLT